MVPVPEELEDDVRRYLTLLAVRKAPGDWSEHSVTRLYEQLDELGRAVMTTLARAVADGEMVTVAGLADAVGVSTRAIRGIAVEITHCFQAAGGPQFSIVLLEPSAGVDLARGLDDENRPMMMPLEGARTVLSVFSDPSPQ
jgi:hypothetical protein